MYFLYSLMLGLGLLLTSPYWIVQMLRSGKYRAGLAERFGRVPGRLRQDRRSSIWVHAVSVGEVLAVSGLIGELRQSFPEYRVLVSTTTATGQKLARERFGADNVFYFSVDFAFAVRRYLRALRPQLIVLAETEFWPNFLRLARASGARIAVVNARISDRSLPRYRRFPWLISRVLANIDVFLAQSEVDRQRLIAIGADPDRVQVSGNLKFDGRPAAASPVAESVRSALVGAGPVVICGSTVEGEEQVLVPAFRDVLERWPKAVAIFAPRHPERFDDVARLVASFGLRFWRRSQWTGESLAGGIFLLDSIGELAAIYGVAQIAFIGGSLVPRGGHNVLEAAQQGAAILVGDHTQNFRDIIALFREVGALRIVTAENVAEAIVNLLTDDNARLQMTRRAAEVLRAHSGATERTVRALEALPLKRPQETTTP